MGSFEEAASAVGPAEPGWLEAWREAGAAADAAVLRFADDQPSLTRLHVARAVWDAACADGSVLVAGSSNIVRDLDLVARARGPLAVIANRGLAGIDGTVATAHGVGLGTGRPVRAVMGDLTFLHDAGGLLLGPGERVPDLHMIVVNDSGGIAGRNRLVRFPDAHAEAETLRKNRIRPDQLVQLAAAAATDRPATSRCFPWMRASEGNPLVPLA